MCVDMLRTKDQVQVKVIAENEHDMKLLAFRSDRGGEVQLDCAREFLQRARREAVYGDAIVPTTKWCCREA